MISFKLLLTIAILTILIDGLFIQFVMKKYWESTVMTIQKSPLKIRLSSALFAYLLLILGIYYFVFKDDNIIMNSIILGLVVYGVFDFTVSAILQDYPVWLMLTDIVWGMTMITIVSYLTNLIAKKV